MDTCSHLNFVVCNVKLEILSRSPINSSNVLVCVQSWSVLLCPPLLLILILLYIILKRKKDENFSLKPLLCVSSEFGTEKNCHALKALKSFIHPFSFSNKTNYAPLIPFSYYQSAVMPSKVAIFRNPRYIIV